MGRRDAGRARQPSANRYLHGIDHQRSLPDPVVPLLDVGRSRSHVPAAHFGICQQRDLFHAQTDAGRLG